LARGINLGRDAAWRDGHRPGCNDQRPIRAREHNAIDGRDPCVQPLAVLHRRLLDDSATQTELEQDLCDAITAAIDLPSVEHASVAWPRASAAVARARALLDQRLTETVTLDEISAHARLDKYRLCHAFSDEG
jgi:hypothetical protein